MPQVSVVADPITFVIFTEVSLLGDRTFAPKMNVFYHRYDKIKFLSPAEAKSQNLQKKIFQSSLRN
jgi:pyoverdine/dityrosine biosynthesis protein Dit1